MDKIDLTLRKEFTANANRRQQFDDTVQYNEKLDYKDQRRAKRAILSHESPWFFGFTVFTKDHLEFFGDNNKRGWEEFNLHETILSITGVLTKTLKLEYDSGFGNENTCDCCGGFRSEILNSQKYGLCDRCERTNKFRNVNFWERREDFAFEETWID